MRQRRLLYNSISSVFLQLSTIICGFILPRLIISTYGSSVNGLVNSIAQFLGFISFLELGIGAIVQSALYKPLADKDYLEVSRVLRSAQKFFNKIGAVLVVYVVVLLYVFPTFISSDFSAWYIGSLLVAMSISYFSQYYFGIVDGLLISSDQHGYISSTAQACTVILNTIVCVVLIKCGFGIQAVKFSTAIIYLIRPIIVRCYIRKHYLINRKIAIDSEPLKQKWNGISQHVASIVLDGTDVIVLTLFSTLSNVSIYSVYYMVVNGIKQLFLSLTNGLQPLLGEMWAKEEQDNLIKTFSVVEWAIHTGIIIVFGCTANLICPFVALYTKNVTDTNYIVPLFAFLITLANLCHGLRLPYNLMIRAANHYKQTQSNYLIAAIINIVISIVTVKIWGLVGVAIGTLCAMSYQTVWMANYCDKQLLHRSKKVFLKQLLIDLFVFACSYTASSFLAFNTISVANWIFLSLKTVIIWAGISAVWNLLFYREFFKTILRLFFSRIKRV